MTTQPGSLLINLNYNKFESTVLRCGLSVMVSLDQTLLHFYSNPYTYATHLVRFHLHYVDYAFQSTQSSGKGIMEVIVLRVMRCGSLD